MPTQKGVKLIKSKKFHVYKEREHGHPGVTMKELIGDSSPLKQVSEVFMFHDAIIDKNKEIFPHSHHGNERLFYVVQGKGEFMVDGEKYVVEEGDLFFLEEGAGVTHGFKNLGKKKLRMIAIALNGPL